MIKQDSVKKHKTKNIVADTNVWYDIANENQNVLQEIKSKGSLCATPINILEIASKIDVNNFQQRQKVAKAIAKYADRFLQSNEDYLGRYWNVRISDTVKWEEATKTVSRAPSFQDLMNGYYDSIDNVRRRHNTELLKEWRGFHYEDFNEKVIKAIESVHPNYMNRTSSGNLRRLVDQKLISQFDSDEMQIASILMTYERVKLAIKVDKINTKYKEKPSQKDVKQVFHKIKNYINAYFQYLKYLATTPAAPDENDLGDHEAFMYLQNKNWILATSDKRWVQIANEICPQNLLNLLPYK